MVYHNILTFKLQAGRNIKKRWKIFILEKENQFSVLFFIL